ncbi:hypothetical protein GCM10017044_10280 [Kordiimonas sediminis]|uniref:Sulfotransferase domain-containing protein n=1 Tax=Kordiimonas sediminis TaxID=1735581 RepID=A0A919AR14_9PROT|nr:hypothetical protein [Kordiimonas sediminis]GHF17789.1 hypothetical protein GCM10017044_10280 [Kordiimonas sediminis]
MSSPYELLYKILQTMPDPEGGINPVVKNQIQNFQSPNIGAILAFPPKVGGTFLRTALIELLSKNYYAYLSRGSYASTDQARDLYFPTFLHHHVTIDPTPKALIAHCHMHANKPNIEIIEVFKLATIVNTRNILDTLVSYNDMVTKEADQLGVDFLSHSSEYYRDMTEDRRRWSLVNIAPIWYARFYAYWLNYTEACREAGKIPPLWTSFEELSNDPEILLSKFARHVDPANTYSIQDIDSALQKTMANKKDLRFNKGTSGRGDAFFTPEEKSRILEIMTFSPEHTRILQRYGVL